MHAILNTSPHDCTSATCIHCIPDKARLNILSLSSASFFLIYHHFLSNWGDHRRPVRVERKKQKEEREGERWQWLKSKRVSGDLILPALKKKKKKLWGCHFLILSSNALWRKFVKLDQGRLKLVYKRRQWREEEEECRTPKASEMPSISPTGWYSFFPLFSSSEL